MRNTTVVRLVGKRLAWYPPGAGDEPHWLDDDSAREKLLAALSQRRLGVCFAVPGADARLLTLPVTTAEKKHIDKSLPFTLEEQVAEDIDGLHFAYCGLDKDTLAVAVCARNKMQGWQALLADFPGISQWRPEPLLLPWQHGEWCLLVEGETVIARLGQCEGFTVESQMLDAVLQGALAEQPEPGAIVVYGRDQVADTVWCRQHYVIRCSGVTVTSMRPCC